MSSAAESDAQLLLPTATGKDDARMGGGMALAKSFKNAMQGEGGGIMHGSMRKSAIRRRKKHQDKLRTEKTDKKRRRERKLAGRIKLKPVGSDDPDAMVLNQHAAMEKRLMRVATKGVVQLFNAVTKLQRQSEDAQKERKGGGGGGGGGASTTTTNNKTSKKFSFISELRKLSTDNGDTDTDGKPEARDATADATVARRREDDEDDDEEAPGASTGWEVLQDGFGTGATKLKDWDRDDGGIAENSIKNKATNKKKNKKKGDAGPSPVDDGVLEDYFEDSSSDDESG